MVHSHVISAHVILKKVRKPNRHHVRCGTQEKRVVDGNFWFFKHASLTFITFYAQYHYQKFIYFISDVATFTRGNLLLWVILKLHHLYNYFIVPKFYSKVLSSKTVFCYKFFPLSPDSSKIFKSGEFSPNLATLVVWWTHR